MYTSDDRLDVMMDLLLLYVQIKKLIFRVSIVKRIAIIFMLKMQKIDVMLKYVIIEQVQLRFSSC